MLWVLSLRELPFMWVVRANSNPTFCCLASSWGEITHIELTIHSNLISSQQCCRLIFILPLHTILKYDLNVIPHELSWVLLHLTPLITIKLTSLPRRAYSLMLQIGVYTWYRISQCLIINTHALEAIASSCLRQNLQKASAIWSSLPRKPWWCGNISPK